MPRFIAGLDRTIPVAAISSVSKKTAPLRGEHIRIEYEVTDPTWGVSRREHVDLWPAGGDEFFNILHEKVRLARERRAVQPTGDG